MSRARILADYVSSGDELADKAPLASPAFTGTPTGITAAHLEAGVLPSDVTGGSGLTALGTVTAGDISHANIVYPAGHVIKYVPGAMGSGSIDTTLDTFQASDRSNTITFTAGNYIYVQAIAGFYCTLGGVDTGGIVQLSTNANNDGNDMIGNLATVYLLNSANNPSMRASYPLSSRIQPSGTSVTVTLKYKAVNGGTISFYKVDSFVDLWEVKA